MEPKAYVVALLLFIGVGVSLADDPPIVPAAPMPAAPSPAPIPRTHVDSTIVGDAVNDSPDAQPAHTGLSNDHGFQAGAPELMKATASLRLSAEQKTKIHAAIEEADAGAAVLIKRENTVREMLAATTPEDPLYAKLQAEQAGADARWNDNRQGLQHAVTDVLTPAQRAKFNSPQ